MHLYTGVWQNSSTKAWLPSRTLWGRFKVSKAWPKNWNIALWGHRLESCEILKCIALWVCTHYIPFYLQENIREVTDRQKKPLKSVEWWVDGRIIWFGVVNNPCAQVQSITFCISHIKLTIQHLTSDVTVLII